MRWPCPITGPFTSFQHIVPTRPILDTMRSGSRRPPTTTLLVLAILCLATSPDPTVGGIPLGNDVHARRRADSLKALIDRTKPTVVWSDRNMLWVDRDATGNFLFAVNQAYQIDDESSRGSWALLNPIPATSRQVSSTSPAVLPQVWSWPKTARAEPCICWNGPHHQTAAGRLTSTRHILVFQNPQGKWKFIGEGPTDGCPRRAQDYDNAYTLRGGMDTGSPIPHKNLCHPLHPHHLYIRRHPGGHRINPRIHPERPASRAFRSVSTDYLETRYGDTLSEIAQRIATCGTFYPLERTPSLKSKMLQNVSDSLTTLNPKLTQSPRPGSRIILPNLATLWDDANHAAGIKNHPSR